MMEYAHKIAYFSAEFYRVNILGRYWEDTGNTKGTKALHSLYPYPPP